MPTARSGESSPRSSGRRRGGCSISGPAALAELVPDRGAAAAGEEFFRSPPFLEAEGVTHTLRIPAAGGELLVPLIVREIPGGGGLDATSPYGYPGLAAPAGARLDPSEVDFSGTELVSVFIRHALGEPPLSGARERNVVQVADPRLPPKSRMSDRQQIRRNERQGYEVVVRSGPDTSQEERGGFLAAYEETMRRAAADRRYLFGAAYFERVLAARRSWLAVARDANGAVAAGSVAVASDGHLHYYLSGTTDAHLRDSPMKNVVAALIELAGELGIPLNLGGGLAPGDRLEEFKRGFANREEPWHTSELICDEQAYARLSQGADAAGFFPAYRAPGR